MHFLRVKKSILVLAAAAAVGAGFERGRAYAGPQTRQELAERVMHGDVAAQRMQQVIGQLHDGRLSTPGEFLTCLHLLKEAKTRLQSAGIHDSTTALVDQHLRDFEHIQDEYNNLGALIARFRHNRYATSREFYNDVAKLEVVVQSLALYHGAYTEDIYPLAFIENLLYETSTLMEQQRNHGGLTEQAPEEHVANEQLYVRVSNELSSLIKKIYSQVQK
jgi:hypothetical protein